MVEGQLRCRELAEYLQKTNAPKEVWLAEDGSGIISKACFDSASNQIVGLNLPLDLKTVLPIPYTFVPESVEDIEKQMENTKPTHVYVILAQPIKENIPPFVLAIYGTDNRFTPFYMFTELADAAARTRCMIYFFIKTYFSFNLYSV